MVSPAGQGQERHPSIVPRIFMINQLGSDQCTWPWGHCLLSELREWRQKTGRHNGLKEFGAPLTIGEAYLKIIMLSFLVFYEWILEAGGVMDKCVQMWTKNYGAVGPDGYGALGRALRKRRGDPKGEVEEKGLFPGRGKGRGVGEKEKTGEKEGKRARKRQGLVVLGSGEENPRSFLSVMLTRNPKAMSKTSCGLDGDKLWSKRLQNGSPYWLGTELSSS
ncbi:hypothetical protein TNCV_4876601 [Trichonephila clavipes]|nr:hypothetical protein TNCV_4876601 [Trichonephila clavipes]